MSSGTTSRGTRHQRPHRGVTGRPRQLVTLLAPALLLLATTACGSSSNEGKAAIAKVCPPLREFTNWYRDKAPQLAAVANGAGFDGGDAGATTDLINQAIEAENRYLDALRQANDPEAGLSQGQTRGFTDAIDAANLRLGYYKSSLDAIADYGGVTPEAVGDPDPVPASQEATVSVVDSARQLCDLDFPHDAVLISGG